MTAGILVFEGAEELDFVGPWEMLAMWGKVAAGPECVLVAERMAPVVCAKGLSVNPGASFHTCPPLDFLIVPGGQGTRTEVSNQALTGFIAQTATSCKAVLSICTGSFLLHASGVLAHRRATTHWASLDRLRALGDVQVEEARFVQDGDIWTSAGVSAGIDMTLAFIASYAGEEVAGLVQSRAEYYPSETRYGSFAASDEAPGYIRGKPL